MLHTSLRQSFESSSPQKRIQDKNERWTSELEQAQEKDQKKTEESFMLEFTGSLGIISWSLERVQEGSKEWQSKQ